jgi:hypothetical protein
MSRRIEKSSPFVILRHESIEAMGMTCSECDTPGAKRLLVFYTMRGGSRRTHNGQFCSKRCHDIFHKLKRPPVGRP